MKRSISKVAQVVAALIFALPVFAQDIDKLKTGGPYVPTPQVVVDQMLRLGGVNDKDYVIDLGSGDGVIVLTAARQYKAGGMGIDIDPDLVRQSNASAQKFGVADRVRFVQLDVFKADLSKASVLTLYLLPGMMMNLRSKVFTELKPGVRVVSHDYHFGDWPSDDSISFEVPEKEMVTGVPRATLYKWIVPAKIAGRWEIKVAGGDTYELSLKQRFQNITDAGATAGGKSLPVQSTSLRGSEFNFIIPDGKGVSRFSGRVNGDAMEGTVELPGGKAAAKWTAMRVATAAVVTE
jgi:hypothetical protein